MDLDSLPFSFLKPTQSRAGETDVTSALEIAGNDVSFPKTGATVRAVPMKSNNTNGVEHHGKLAELENTDLDSHHANGALQPVSRPGDTSWKGAVGVKPAAPTPPPDITMICRDESLGVNAEQLTLLVRWDMSWSDVLDLLRYHFGRSCVFSYEVVGKKGDPVDVTVADEGAFDAFCSHAEGLGGRCEVVVKSASWRPSEFITGKLEEQFPMHPVIKKRQEPVDEDAEIVAAAIALRGEEEALEGDEVEEPDRHLTFWERLEDSPYPLGHMLCFGGVGLLGSCVAVVYGYWTNLNTLAAITVALPVNVFLMSFFVPAVEDGAPSLVRLGVGFTGFFSSIGCIICYSLAYELISLSAAFIWLLSSFWYIELTTKARGWSSWFTGLFNLYEWIIGGCVLPGVRKSEPRESITILGKPPRPTVFTALQTVEERHPGCDWVPMATAWEEAVKTRQRIKVMHVGQLLMTLSESGHPMGPFEEGILEKRLARQLRKWLMRNGKKTERDMRRFKQCGVGEVLYYGSTGTQVRWSGNGESTYHKTGEDGCYELIRFIEEPEEKLEAGMFADGTRMHGGGSTLTTIQTFVQYFMARFCAFLWYWIAFCTYMLVLYALIYTISENAATTALDTATYQPQGRFYPAQPGSGIYLHIHCKGYTEASPNGKPAVIMEAMEGIGTGISMARLQDEVAKRGVGCVYDRAGFGFSSSNEAQHAVWQNRTPSEIARQLHYALTLGADAEFQQPVGWKRTIVDAGKTVEEWVPVRGPYVMLGLSAGALYTRQFAHDYPDVTAAMVLIDPAPAVNGGLLSEQQKMLSPFSMWLCTKFLQPTGIIRTFLPGTVNDLFAEKTKFVMNGGDQKDKTDFEAMTSKMFARHWCPTVYAEHQGLFSGSPRGIDSVAAADLKGYAMPALVWSRSASRLGGTASTEAVYDYNPNATAARRGGAILDSLGQELKVPGGRRQSGRVSWLDIQRAMLPRLQNSWLNPFSLQPDVMQGDPASCLSRECTEYTMIENSVENADALLDVWFTLGYQDLVPGNIWYLTLGITASEFDAAKFKKDLALVLRHVQHQNIEIFAGPEETLTVEKGKVRRIGDRYDGAGSDGSDVGLGGGAPGGGPARLRMVEDVLRRGEVDARKGGESQRARRGDEGGAGWDGSAGWVAGEDPTDQAHRRQRIPDSGTGCGGFGKFQGYSGSACGADVYRPLRNRGAIRVSMILYAHKSRSVSRAEANLRGNEDLANEPTSRFRRSLFMRTWRVVGVSEVVCSNGTQVASCETTGVDLHSSVYMEPPYECPQNTYTDGPVCALCGLEETSPTGSKDRGACRTCDTQQLAGGGFRYTYLSCDGTQCLTCPTGTLSSKGALGLADCVPLPKMTLLLQGPLGRGSLARSVSGMPIPGGGLDFPALKSLIGNITGISQSRLTFDPPQEELEYPDSRCAHQRGRCLVRVSFLIFAESSAQLAQAEAFLGGTECTVYDAATCPNPETNGTRVPLRGRLVTEFGMTHIFKAKVKGAESGECPNRWIVTGETQENIPHLTDSYAQPKPTCPAGFYELSGHCDPCPDMTTSDSGAVGVSACEPLNSVILVGKDASLTFQARTDPAAWGIKNAQPNSIDVYSANQRNASYVKIRGYAVQPDQLVNVFDPTQGYQADRCGSGLNCFNQTDFRVRVSEVTGGLVPPDGVRLLFPRNCDPFSGGLPSALYPAVPPSVKASSMCGPFAGLPTLPVARQCVCATDPNGADACFWTMGRGLIGRDMGTAVNSLTKRATAADCAADTVTSVSVNAFLYDPDTKNCLHRSVGENSAGLNTCPSRSALCREQATFVTDDLSIIDPGTAMWWRDRTGVCKLVTERARKCSNKVGFESRVFTPTQTGLENPLDTFFVIVNLHAPTRSAVRGAYQRLLGEVASSARAALLSKYSITQVLSTTDKALRQGRSAEWSLVADGRVDPAVVKAIQCLPKCPSGGTPECRAVTGELDTRRPVPTCSAASRVSACRNNLFKPQCTATLAPTCACADAVDEGINALFTVMPLAPGDHLTLHLAIKSSDLDLTHTVVTKIEIAQGPGPNWIPLLLLSFTDGSHQYISLAKHTRRQVIYIHPVLTYEVRVSLPNFGELGYDTSGLGISLFKAHGQVLEDTFATARPVNLFKPGYGADAEYQCPPTTYRKWGDLGSAATGCCAGAQCTDQTGDNCMCAPCPYPYVSRPGSTGVEECVCPRCGDGGVAWQADEKCDDNNTAVLDGCSNVCQIDNLQMCQGPTNEATGVGQPLQSYSNKDTCLLLGSFWNSFGVAPFADRQGAVAVTFKNALWVTGGAGTRFHLFYNDVWFEDTNGYKCIPTERTAPCPASSLTWGLASPAQLSNTTSGYVALSSYPPRAYHGTVSFNGFLWVIGGADRGGWFLPLNTSTTAQRSCAKVGNNWACSLDRSFNDVWRTSGTPDTADLSRVKWSQVTASAGWAARAYHSTLVFKNKLWVMAGATLTYQESGTQTVPLADVWSSTDGSTWAQETPTADWGARQGQAATVDPTKTKIFLMGGLRWGSRTYLNDVWSSTDGKAWTQVTANADFGGRWLHTALIFQGNMWVVGGMRCGAQQEGSTNGVYVENLGACSEVNQQPGHFYRDVWVATEGGTKWDLSTSTAGWSGRGGHIVAAWDSAGQTPALPTPRNNLWVIGGAGPYSETNAEVWMGFEF